MAGLMSAEEVYERAREAAVAATGPDERPLQIDYDGLKEKIRAALGDRKVSRCHVNKFLPEGYEDQGRLNLVLLTAGNVLYDIVIGDQYFRYDIVSVGQLDKVQLIDAVWDNREKRREEPFLSLRLMHGEETHLLLALNDEERASLLGFASAVAAVRNPER
jgi:hypothetical protein